MRHVTEDSLTDDVLATLADDTDPRFRAWRPAPIHFRVGAAGYRDLITELYPDDDRYIDEDAVFGVRESLAVPFVRIDSAEEAARHNLTAPFFELRYNFVLRPA